jgi:hypothetical protein
MFLKFNFSILHSQFRLRRFSSCKKIFKNFLIFFPVRICSPVFSYVLLAHQIKISARQGKNFCLAPNFKTGIFVHSWPGKPVAWFPAAAWVVIPAKAGIQLI